MNTLTYNEILITTCSCEGCFFMKGEFLYDNGID